MMEELRMAATMAVLALVMLVIYWAWLRLHFAVRSALGLAVSGALTYVVVLPVGLSGPPLFFLISAGITLIYVVVLIVRVIQAVRWTVRKARGGATQCRDG